MRLAASLAALVTISASPALASGGFSCTTDNGSTRFTIESGLARGAGNPIFNFRGDLDILDTTVAADLRTSKFTQDHLMQHWIDDKILNLQLHREREGDKPFGEIDLTILAKQVEEGSYAGSYELRVRDMAGDTTDEGKMLELAGKTSCFVE